MKRLLLILILTLSFQSLTNADDISDFEIEGMSIGDSLLDFYSETEIKKNIFSDYPNSDRYRRFFIIDSKSFETYEGVQVNFKKNDKNYIIQSISGEIKYRDGNIEDCYKLLSVVVSEISKSFPNTKKQSGNDLPKRIDPTGASTFTVTEWYFSSGDSIQAACSDYSKIFEKKRQYDDLAVSLDTNDFIQFIINEAYN